MIVPVSVLSMGQIDLFNSFKNNVTYNYSLTNHIYLICMDKQKLALNNLQGFICRKTKPSNKTKVVKETRVFLGGKNENQNVCDITLIEFGFMAYQPQ